MTSMRGGLARAVTWAPARTAVKYATHAGARVRGAALVRTHRLPEVANVFAASCPKSGSQWIKEVLDHPLVRARTGLLMLPQLDYYQRPLRRFPAGTFVPGLYLSYDAYARLDRPYPHRTVYVFRDPRDIVVSGYFSALESHPEMLGLAEHRARLQELPVGEGLLHALDMGRGHLRDMATWVGVDDPGVRCWRLEDIAADPDTEVSAILEFCGVHLPDAELATVLRDTSREALQQRDLAQRRDGAESHYRVRARGFRELFGPEHHAAVEEVVPGLIARLGYPA